MSIVRAPLSRAEIVRAAMAWNEPRAVRRYTVARGTSPEQADRCFEALKQFLAVCALADTARAPSREVDEMWHVALMFTRAYRELCERLGRHLDHEPLDAPVEEAVYATTRAEAEAVFGRLDQEHWPLPGTAPRCGSMYVP
ncbi:MAG TPA: hypothetical protein VF250_14965 [Conexibacter sp.]